jgi:hypothetical protein
MQKSNTDLTAFLGSGDLPEISEADMVSAIKEVVSDTTSGSGGVDFMSFSGKTGRYSVGRDKEELDNETLFAMEPQSIVEGWTCWKGQRVVDRKEWRLYDRKDKGVAKEDLEDHGPYRDGAGEGWKKTLGFGVVELTPLDGMQVKFSSNSASGNNAIADLITKVADRTSAKEPNIPMIQFDREEFTAQEQKNFKPKLVVASWVERANLEAYFDGGLSEDDLIAGKKGKAKRKK